MNISFRQLRAFVVVAETGSFSRAADKLFLTQSALSGLIKDLEATVAVKLFDRTTRQVSLSNVGEQLLPQAKRILNELAVFEREVTSLTDLAHGEIRLAVSQQFAASILPLLIAKFYERYPNITITLVDCSVENVLKHLEDREVDLGIGAEREYSEDIQADFLFELPFFVVLPANHALTKENQITWSQLEPENLISLHGPFSQKLASELPPQLVKKVFQPKYQVNLISTALGMTSKNLGVTICLPFATELVEQQGLQMRLLTEPVIPRRFYLYRQKNRALSPAVATLSEFIQQYLTENPLVEMK